MENKIRGSEQNLKFNVSGEFITNLARTWFWNEKKPYAKVEELLLNCMNGSNKTKNELKEIAKEVILGGYEFTGETEDNSFGIDKDGKFNPIKQIELEREFYIHKIASLENELNNHYINDEDTEEDTEEVEVDESDNKISSIYGTNSLLESFMNASKYEDNYGFITPLGEFIPSDWGTHNVEARTIVENKNWGKEYNHWIDKTGVNEHKMLHCDFLVFSKGWILLHSPQQGLARPTYNTNKEMTKAQKEFLYDYYMNRNETKKASDIWLKN